MSQQTKRWALGSARAVTGLLILGVSAATAVALGTGIVAVPAVERGVVSLQVDTSQESQNQVVCAGAFAELGVDPTNPGVAVPSGDALVMPAGERAGEDSALVRELEAGSAPSVLRASPGDPFAAAQAQQVYTTSLQGLAASSCVEPKHEQWLVGGATSLGVNSTLVLGNPFDVSATVQVTLYDETGKVDSSRTAGVMVPAGAQRIVSLNGYAPARERLAVRVESTGAAVAASMGVSHTIDIRSFAVDQVTSQSSPNRALYVPGFVNFADHDHGPTGMLEDEDEFAAVVRVLAPGRDGGEATVFAHLENGDRTELGTFEFEAQLVTDFTVRHWPEDAHALSIEASVPVVGGAFGSADQPPTHDYAWFAPAPVIDADAPFAAAVVPGGVLVLMNPGDTAARITARGADGNESDVEVPAGAAVPLTAAGDVLVTSTQPIAAGVRVLTGSNIAGYPVLVPTMQHSTLTVYPR